MTASRTGTYLLFFCFSLLASAKSGAPVGGSPSPKGFYCTANAWRVYRVLPKETPTVEPIAATHRVIEQSLQNQENDGNGRLAVFKLPQGEEFYETLEFSHGEALMVHALAAPNGSVSFAVKLVTRADGKVTKILGEHREVFRPTQKEIAGTAFSANIPNIEVSNAYVRLETSMLQDKNFDRLASSVQKGQLPEGSITEATVECSPQ